MAEARQPEIKVELTGKGAEIRPDSIELKGKQEKVDAVLATWTEGGQGPSGRSFANRLNRTFFRLRLKDGSVYEIAHELPENRKAAARWVLVQQLPGQPSDGDQAPAASGAKPAKEAGASAGPKAATPKPSAAARKTPAKKTPARTAKSKTR